MRPPDIDNDMSQCVRYDCDRFSVGFLVFHATIRCVSRKVPHLMRTGNPVLNSRAFESFGLQPRDVAAESSHSTTMTVDGTVNRTIFLLA